MPDYNMHTSGLLFSRMPQEHIDPSHVWNMVAVPQDSPTPLLRLHTIKGIIITLLFMKDMTHEKAKKAQRQNRKNTKSHLRNTQNHENCEMVVAPVTS